MSEILIREVLVFGGAVAGALWGYFLGRIIERRRWVSELSPNLEALEGGLVKVCQGLEGLEQSLLRMGSTYTSETSAWTPSQPDDVLTDAKIRVLSIEPSDERGIQRVISR